MSKNALTRTELKTIAVIAMTIDHIAEGFIPKGTIPYLLCKLIGKITAPIMAFFVSEGYHYTRSRKKYAMRLLSAGLISSIPYSLYLSDGQQLRFSVIFNLFLGFSAIWLLEEKDVDLITRLSLFALMLFLSLQSDWNVFIPLWCVLFHIWRRRSAFKWIMYFVTAAAYALLCAATVGYTAITAAGLIIPALLLGRYADKKEQNQSEARKMFFYLFYPLHLTVLLMIKLMI